MAYINNMSKEDNHMTTKYIKIKQTDGKCLFIDLYKINNISECSKERDPHNSEFPPGLNELGRAVREHGTDIPHTGCAWRTSCVWHSPRVDRSYSAATTEC